VRHKDSSYRKCFPRRYPSERKEEGGGGWGADGRMK
jgi:hypothetical protein